MFAIFDDSNFPIIHVKLSGSLNQDTDFLDFQNVDILEIYISNILASGNLHFKILTVVNLNFKILTFGELHFNILTFVYLISKMLKNKHVIN